MLDNQRQDGHSHEPQSYVADEDSIEFFLLSKYAEGCSETTVKTLRWIFDDLRRFRSSFCIPLSVDDFSKEHLVAYFANLRERDNNLKPGKKLEKNTINKHWRGIRLYYTWLHESCHKINKNPTDGIKPPRAQKKIVPTFTEHHITEMLKLCPPNKRWGIRDRAIILTFLLSGIRCEELSNLEISNLYFREHYIKIYGKGDKERKVFMDPRLTKAFINWLMLRPKTEHDRVFLSFNHKNFLAPLEPNGLRQLIARIGKSAKIEDARCSPHTFRHTFGVNLLRAGKDIRFVQEVMGHATLQSTEIYVRTLTAEDSMEWHQLSTPFKTWKL